MLEMTIYLRETFFSGQREGWVLPMVRSRVWQPGTILHPSQKWALGWGHRGSPTPGNQAPLWGRTGWGPTLAGQGRAKLLGAADQPCCSVTGKGSVRPWGPGHGQGGESPEGWAGTGRPFIALKAVTYLNLNYQG